MGAVDCGNGDVDNDIWPEMVWVQIGSFLLGSSLRFITFTPYTGSDNDAPTHHRFAHSHSCQRRIRQLSRRDNRQGPGERSPRRAPRRLCQHLPRSHLYAFFQIGQKPVMRKSNHENRVGGPDPRRPGGSAQDEHVTDARRRADRLREQASSGRSAGGGGGEDRERLPQVYRHHPRERQAHPGIPWY
ncbi:hypothetical protein BC936DRAFT_148874 [Jimgerdemannia flammicorona]|uniref:Uncharacterized protein n=1 Tax=Jimgerdemannia flammicorona TaxID=994334 RepID=A0A433D239_9FUNG|nr:hypothetical protein BC936DRAFT_148874 [Jimgerdemannia flammicorona]